MRRLERFALAAGALAALLLGTWGRLSRWAEVFPPEGGVFLAPSDSYYYVRLARLALERFPQAPTFDAYVGFPGMECPWPPGHALLLSLGLLGTHAPPFSEQALGLMAWSGPLLSLAGALVVGLLAARTLGPRAGLAAAAPLLLLPAVVTVGELGEADHHVHEPLFTALALLCWLVSLRPGRGPLRWAAAAGAAAGLSHLFSTSGMMVLPPLALGVLAAHPFAPRRWRRARALGVMALVALVPATLGAAWLGHLGWMDYVRLSGFHVTLLLGALAAAGLPFLLGRAPRRHRRSRRLRWAAVFTFVALAGLAWRGAGPLLTGLAHARRGSVILSAADESVPLMAEGLGGAWMALGGVLLALPLLLGLLARGARARRSAALPLLAYLGLLLVLTLLQYRFSRPLAGVVAVAGVWAVVEGLSGLRWRRPVGALLLGLLLVPLPQLFEPAEGVHPVLRLTWSSLRFLRERTPPTSGLWDGAPPEYAVAAPWVMGHLLATVAERPALSSPFGQVERAEALAREEAHLFAEREPAQVWARMERLGARYVLALPWPGGNTALRHITGEPVTKESPGWLEVLRRTPALTGRLRQHFVASEAYEDAPVGRVFALVPGARLRVTGLPPHAELTLRGTLTAEASRPLEERVRVDAEGTLHLVLPHAAGDFSEALRLELPDGRLLPVEATEEDVTEGRTRDVALSLVAGAP